MFSYAATRKRCWFFNLILVGYVRVCGIGNKDSFMKIKLFVFKVKQFKGLSMSPFVKLLLINNEN